MVRGRATPAAAQACWVRLEQSQLSGPVLPNAYGLPSWARAKLTARVAGRLVPAGRAKPAGSAVLPVAGRPSPAVGVHGAAVPCSVLTIRVASPSHAA